MRREGDAAIVAVVGDLIPNDQIVAVRAGLVGQQDAAGIVIDDIVRHRRMMNRGQMDALTAVESLACFPWRDEGTTAGIGGNL